MTQKRAWISPKRKPGRPVGPTPERTDRPWDPEYLTYKHKLILLHVAANSHLRRWQIARHLRISVSYLSTLTCCPAGRQLLEQLEQAPATRLLPFRINFAQEQTKEQTNAEITPHSS